MALQALAVDRRWVLGAAGAAGRLVAVEAETGSGRRSDHGLCLLVAAIASELGVDRSAQ